MAEGRAEHGIQPGELYFLSHPGADAIFSGYGLTQQRGRSDRLAGLLMVDRPAPADPTWLAEVEETFGGYSLVPMTSSGERGIACQMRIEGDSLPFVQQLPHPAGGDIRRALEPFLVEPPAPTFKLRWDGDHAAWVSRPWVGLPLPLQEAFDRAGYGCLAIERGDTVAFVTHAPDEDIESFRGAPVLYRWELIELPNAPIIRFRATIFDKLEAPYALEHFLNVEDPEQARCLARLVEQEELVFDFFGGEYEYAYSKHLPHEEDMRAGLQLLVSRAFAFWEALPEAARDFDRAKDVFQRWFPM